jgi:prepilin-type N-terminal cleavage/methylation domain-containing protein
MKKGFSGGFTLLEMAAALAILAAFMAALFGVLIPMVQAFNRQQARHELFMETERALKSLNEAVSGAFGWLEGDTLGVSLISGSGDTISIRRSGADSSLCINHRKVLPEGYHTAGFRILYKPMASDAGSLPPPERFAAVDADADGKVRGNEVSNVASLELSLTAVRAKESHTGSTYPKIPQPIVGIELGE